LLWLQPQQWHITRHRAGAGEPGVSEADGRIGRVELRPGYREWAPPAALRPAVSCLWTSVVPSGGQTLVLPDACADLIWRAGAGALVAGPDTGPVLTVLASGTVLVGVRFAPGGGGAALGLPLTELRDRRVDLADLLPGLAPRLPGDLSPGVALGRLLELTAGLVSERPPDPLVSQGARLLAASRERTDELARDLGVSERQFRRRCLDAVGYGPKTLHRVLRFRRFVSRIDAADGGVDLARVAAEAGYADQAHMTRESVRLAGLPPAALIRARRP
jgi:AraC-like DNA-binding protein